ncbi:MAG: hypothetical protein WCK33_11845 [Phycisphaerae bacterium]
MKRNSMFGMALRRMASVAVAIAATGLASAQEATKLRLRVQQVGVTSSAQAATTGSAGASLRQVVEAADSQLLNAVEQTRKFEMVPRDPNAVIREQDFAQSGNVSKLDAKAAKPFQMAGVSHIAMVTIDNYQDVTSRMELGGSLGATQGERRVIQLQAVVSVIDATKATVLRSTNVRLERAQTNEVLAGSTVDGRATDALVGLVSRDLAKQAANAITDMLYPAKVVGYTLGTITFNRTAGSGAANGQYWRVYAAGEEMKDPDTGESLGREEVPVGWAVVTEAGDRFSKAEAIVDNGIDRGAILRLSETGLPAGVDASQRARGSASASGSPSAASTGGATGHATVGGTGGGAASVTETAATVPVRCAIFVKNRIKELDGDLVMVLEDQLKAAATGPMVEIISREDAANAVARFSTGGANAGTGTAQSQEADRLFSDRASAVSIAQTLGADYVLVASLSSIEREEMDYDDGTTRTKVQRSVLRCTYAILDGTTGGTVVGGSADAERSIRQTPNLTVKADVTMQLINDTARQMGERLRGQAETGKVRAAARAAEEVEVTFDVYLADMKVPALRRRDDGSYALQSESVDVGVMSCEVQIDGVTAGSASGTMKMKPGFHKVRFVRPMCEPEERVISAKGGQTIRVGMRLTAEGRRQWLENAVIFQQLQEAERLSKAKADAADRLSEAELLKAKGAAKFLEQSGFRMNLDTASWKGLVNL